MAITIEILGDNEDLKRKLEECKRAFAQMGQTAQKEGAAMDSSLRTAAKGAATLFSIAEAKQFVTQLIAVRGQFQQLEIAFSTMLGSQEKATALMNQLTQTAAKTPFDLQGIAGAAKQMLAYGSAAENVNSELIMLGNVASGVSAPLGDIAYLYGTLRTQGRAYLMDIRQFAGRGIPIYDELAKVMGVSKDKISGLVSAGKIGFPQVEQAFKGMTAEGGRFYNLMEAQSKSLTGQISNLGDAWDMMLNDMGQSSEGVLSSGISAVSYMIEHYETFGKILVGLIATYGAYKAGIIVLSVAQRINTAVTQQMAIQQSIAALSGHALSNAQALATVKTMLLTKAMHGLKAAFLSNPVGIILSGLALVAGTMLTLSSSTDDATSAFDEFNESTAKTMSNLDMIMALLKNTDSNSKTYKDSIEKLNAMCKEYNLTLLSENSTVEEQIKKYNQLELVIKASNAEKMRAKGLEDNQTNYEKGLAEQKKELNEVLQEATYTSYEQDDLEGMERAVPRAIKAIRENAEQVSPAIMQVVSDAANTMSKQTEKEADKTFSNLLFKLKKILLDVGISEKDADRFFKYNKEELYATTHALVELNKQKKEGDEVTNKSADSLEREDKAHIDAARATSIQTKSTQDLNAELEKIKSNFQNIGVKISIKADFELNGAEKKFFNNVTDGQISAQLVTFENALKQLQNGAKSVSIKFFNGFVKNYTKDMAQDLVNDYQTYSSALGLRNNSSTNYDKSYNDAKKEWEDAKKKTESISKDKKAFTDKQYKDAKEAENTAKKNFDNLGGNPSTPNKPNSPKAVDWKAIGAEETKDAQDYSDKVADITKRGEMERRQAVIDGMVESSKMELAQIGLNYDKKKYEIERQEADLVEALRKRNLEKWKSENPNKKDYEYTGTTSKDDLSPELKTMLANANQSNDAARDKANKAIGDKERVRQNEYLRDYGTFEEKKLAIANLYADRIANAETKEDKDRAKKEQEKEQNTLIDNYIKFSSDYIDKIRESNQQQEDLKKGGVADNALEVIKQINAKSTEELITGFGAVSQEYLDFCNELVGLSVEQLASKLTTLQGQLSSADKGTGGDQTNKDKVNKMLTAKIKTLEAQVKVQVTKKDVSGSNISFTETIELMNDVTRTINTVIDGFDNMSDEAKNTSRSILSIATGSIGLIDGIQKVTEFGIQSMFKTTEVAGKSMSAVEKASVILTIISTAFQIAMAIMNLINPDNKKEKEIQALQKQVDGLDKSYEKLDKTLDGVYSNDAKKIILDQEQMLIQQKALVQQQQALESSKKSPDDGKMDGFSDKLDEINDKLDETKDKIIEAVIGKDVNGAIDEFASKWVDAIGSGEDKAEAMKGVVRGMVKSAVTELVKSRMSGEVKAFMEYLASAMEDEILAPAEERMLDSLQAKIQTKGESLDKSFSKYLEEDNGRNASSKGIAQASQESIDKLDGMVTTIQSHTFNIVEQNKSLLLINRAIMDDVSIIRQQSMLLDHLSRLEGIENGIVSMKRDISSIQLQGINLKR